MCKELHHDEMYVKLGHDEGLHMSSGVFCGYCFFILLLHIVV